MNYRSAIANAISSLNLMFGVLSVFATFEGEYKTAAIMIILAVVADSLDGRAARALGVSGEFGKELDSLCDVCSFGVAPGILIYQYALMDIGLAGKLLAAFFAVCGALRLARFNVNAAVVHGYFVGMPIPAGGCIVSAYILSGYQFPVEIVAVGTAIVAVIMYSEIKFPDFKGKGNPMYPAPVVISVAAGLYLLYMRPVAWPFVIMFTYTMAGIINHIYVKATNK